MTRQTLLMRLAGVVMLVAAIIVVAVSVGVPSLTQLRTSFAGMGGWAGVVFAGLYAAALRVRDFLTGTVVGILPATTAYVTVGAYGRQPGSWPLWAAVATLVALSVAGLGAGRWRRRRHTATRATRSEGEVTARATGVESRSTPR